MLKASINISTYNYHSIIPIFRRYSSCIIDAYYMYHLEDINPDKLLHAMKKNCNLY